MGGCSAGSRAEATLRDFLLHFDIEYPDKFQRTIELRRTKDHLIQWLVVFEPDGGAIHLKGRTTLYVLHVNEELSQPEDCMFVFSSFSPREQSIFDLFAPRTTEGDISVVLRCCGDTMNASVITGRALSSCTPFGKQVATRQSKLDIPLCFSL